MGEPQWPYSLLVEMNLSRPIFADDIRWRDLDVLAMLFWYYLLNDPTNAQEPARN